MTKRVLVKDNVEKVCNLSDTISDVREKYEILAESARLLISNEAPDKIIQTICEKLIKHLGCQIFLNYLVSQDNKCLRLNTYAGIPKHTAKEINCIDARFSDFGLTDLALYLEVEAYACLQLIYRGETIGILAVGSFSRSSFTKEELEIMQAVADQVTLIAYRKLHIAKQSIEHMRFNKAIDGKRFNNVIDNMIEGCQIIDFNYCYYYLNNAALSHSCYTKEEMLGHTIMEKFPGIETTYFFLKLKKCLEKRISFKMENLFTFRDGKTEWFLLSVYPVSEGAFILSRNITESKQKEAREFGVTLENTRLIEAGKKKLHVANELLCQTEKQHRQIIEVSTDGYLIYSENKIIYANPAMLQILGSDKAEEIDLNSLGKCISPEKLHEIKNQLARSDLTKQPVHLGEITLLGAEGIPVTLDMIVIPVIFEGKKAHQYIVRNVTQRKEIEKEMARLDRLNIIGEMAAGIGHEVRNPMTSVRGFLQLLANKEPNYHKLEYYRIMIEELDRANSIITEFLSLAKDRAVDLELISLNAILDTLYPLLTAQATKLDQHIRLQKGSIPNLLLNEKEIRQLIINLVKNGMDAMPFGGCLTAGTYQNEDEVVLFVEDEGTGIKPEILDKLGTPFVTTKAKGTGLGLSICYSIADKHNARIDVKTGSAGTTFGVRFKQP